MPGSEGLVSCVGGCNSKIFASKRVHRPLVDNVVNIHLQSPPKSDNVAVNYYRNRYRLSNTPPAASVPLVVTTAVKGVKKSRKRRDRKASGVSLDTSIKIEHESDDEEKPKRSLSVQFMFWFCGVLIVVLGVGALIYAIYLMSTSMDKLTKVTNSHATVTKQWRKVSGKRFGETAGNLVPWDTPFPP